MSGSYHSVHQIKDALMQSFVNYVLFYYGRNGIYSMGATRTMVCDTINKYLDLANGIWKLPIEYTTIPPCTKNIAFSYDTMDRELIRDLLMLDYGLTMPD